MNAETDGDRPVLDLIGRMGQPLFGRITPDGYSDRAEQWLSSGAMVARLNFASALATNRIKGTSVKLDPLFKDADEKDHASVAGKLIRLTLFGDVSDRTRAALAKAFESESPVVSAAAPPNVPVAFDSKTAPPPPPPATYVSELVTLLIGSPEFQHR